MTEGRHNLRLNAHPGVRFRPAGRLGGSSQLTGGRRLLLFPALFDKKMHSKMKIHPDKYCRISKHLARNGCRTVPAAILNRKAYSKMKVYPGMCFRIIKSSAATRCKPAQTELFNKGTYSKMKVYPGMCFRISKTSSRPHGRSVRAAITILTCRTRTGSSP